MQEVAAHGRVGLRGVDDNEAGGEDAAVDGGEGAGALSVIVTVSTDHLRSCETREETCCDESHRDRCSALAELNGMGEELVDVEAFCIWDASTY